MDRSPIQKHTSALVKNLVEESKALRSLDQTTVKGRLRELFVGKLLSKFLTRQFGIGSGVIINQVGKRSKQIDIIIYDNRILPPFIEEQNIGVYPVECVLAAIEVRSQIDKTIIKDYATAATALFDEVYNPEDSWYYDYPNYTTFYCLLGFCNETIFKEQSFEEIWQWNENNVKPLFGVCVINQFSWLHVCTDRGALHLVDENNEETKAFITILLDNARTQSQQRYLHLMKHNDWLGIYARDQAGIKIEFDRRKAQREQQEAKGNSEG